MSPARVLYVALPALIFATSRGVADETSPASRPAGNGARQSVPLDLALGDMTRYFDAAELAKPLPEALEEIVVNGQRAPDVPHPSQRAATTTSV